MRRVNLKLAAADCLVSQPANRQLNRRHALELLIDLLKLCAPVAYRGSGQFGLCAIKRPSSRIDIEGNWIERSSCGGAARQGCRRGMQ